MRDDSAQMRALLDRLGSVVSNLDFTLSVAENRNHLGEELLEDINFDVQDLLMFSRGVRDAWRNSYDG